MSESEFRNAMEDGDHERLRRLWSHAFPSMPQPAEGFESLASMHMARAQAESVTPAKRYYSHSWLLDHDLPSRLPDELRPAAERAYPRVARCVGISVNMKSDMLRPVKGAIVAAMTEEVEDAAARGELGDSALVRGRMMGAYDRTKRYFRDLFDEALRSASAPK